MKSLMALLLMSLLLFPIGLAAQVDAPPDPAPTPNLVYGGMTYDAGAQVSVGFAKSLGGSLLTFQTFTGGPQSVGWTSKIAYMLHPTENMYIGALAGPGGDWVNQPDQPAVAYLIGAAGGLMAYNVTEMFGLWAMIEYKYSEDNEMIEGVNWGIGVHGWF